MIGGNKFVSGHAAIPVPPVIRCFFSPEGALQSTDFQQQ
jgi:hypothetical protein